VKIGDLVVPSTERGPDPDSTVLSVSETRGLVPQDTRFRRRIALKDVSKYRVVKYGDVVFNPFLLWNRAVGVCFIPTGGCVSPAYVVLRPKNPETATFLHYFLRSRRFMMAVDNIASGSVTRRRTAPLTDILNLEFDLPDVQSQRRVSEALGTLDGQIDVNRRISQTLEQIARTLFKSWFVDFDAAAVPRDVWELFPRRLVESRVGSVPEGWEIAPLGKHVEVTRGLSYSGAGLADGGMPMHNLNSIREGGGYNSDGIKHFIGEYRDRDVVVAGDVIVANTDLTQDGRIIGSPALVPRCFGNEGLYSHHIYRLRTLPDSPLTPHWLYLLLVQHRAHQQVVGYSNGTTVNMLPKDGIKKQIVAIPPPEIVKRFEAFVAPLLEQQEVLTEESKTLSQLRDTLLPKLISGEIRVGVDR
jgi:type I restriction enzyme S subunit